MSSLFPGMNPFLEHESAWHDFHENFMPAAQEALNRQILPKYFAKIDEHVYIHEPDLHQPDDETRRLIGRADVWVASTARDVDSGGASTLVAPASVQQVVHDEERLSFLEIREKAGRRLVTVIELLSPANKLPGRHRSQFLRKRDEYLASDAHYVEIDLLRGGPRLPWLRLPDCDYYALVSRVQRRPDAGVWPVRLRESLPTIPIPLAEGDPDARLDLQSLLHRIYDAAGYAVYVYDNPPDPPLHEDDARWAQALLSSGPAVS